MFYQESFYDGSLHEHVAARRQMLINKGLRSTVRSEVYTNYDLGTYDQVLNLRNSCDAMARHIV